MRIGNNLNSLNSWRHLNHSDRNMQRTMQRLSSGLRIAITADDPTGQAMSQRLRSQSRSMNQAARNGQDTISLLQTAEGAMQEIQEVLHRMRELSIQAANDSLTQSDRWEIQREIDQLRNEITKIANTTEYNGMKLLVGNNSKMDDAERFTRVFVRDTLSHVDQFGTDVKSEGNYRLRVEAEAGVAQVQKSNIMTLKEPAEDGRTVARQDTQLHEIQQFYTAEGGFMLEEGRSLTIIQGNDRRATITLYRNNTIGDVQERLQTAIAKDFDQQKLVAGEDPFASYVETGDVSGPEAVEGTFLLRSALAGNDGDFHFVGDDDLLSAFGFTAIQASSEHRYHLSVEDAHSGEVLRENIEVVGNYFAGVVHHGVDVQVAGDTGVEAVWDAESKSFVFKDGALQAETIDIHLHETSRFFHLGANPFQGIGIAIGDLRAEALGVDRLMVLDKDLATEAISKIERAAAMVSDEQGSMGALQNRVEHAVSYLQISTINLQASESRIKDADMAFEMMQYTRTQIIMQAGTSMLAQANMRPQSILQLIS